MMARMDRGRGGLVVADIASPDVDLTRYGVTYDEVMGTIHGVMPDGRLVTGMEVFRRAYGAVGWGWVLAPTGWPVLRSLFDLGYRWFARHRLWLTGRRGACAGGACRIDRA